MEKVIIVTDLGPGDGGKGSIIHSLARKEDASVIIKRGGAQGSHGVRTSRGESFNFSQWGCGTFDAIPTFLSNQMVIMPVGLENEAGALKRHGIHNPFAMLSVDYECIVATPFHKIASQIEELLRKEKPRGTIGTGVGQAYRMCNNLKDDYTLLSHQLSNRRIITKVLKKQRTYYRDKYANLSYDEVLPEDKKLLAGNLALLFDDDFLPYIVDLFEAVGEELSFRTLEEVLKTNGTAIVECSHGILTDNKTGFRPHVSAIRTLPEFTERMLKTSGYNGQIINLGVHRAYEIRHGAGPMPTYDAAMTAKMLPDSHKDWNRWQGGVRAGALDFNLLRYALLVGAGTKFDGICLTWFDQILNTSRDWQQCLFYKNRPRDGESYAEFLTRAEPTITHRQIIKPISEMELFGLVNDSLVKTLGIPLAILSVGATEKFKIYPKEGR
ncbi:MAG: adenylosuccinate synthetase [Candidatus Saccharibacteria bacterium]|nr:adenylosuccinate synthetase [Candidatus Saccharibacteria bacterium]